jgi:hypothetical protein
MAKRPKDSPLDGARGGLSQELVIKQYDYGTVVTKYPDMSRVVRTPAQEAGNQLFKEAVAYAKQLVRDPKRKAAFAASLRPGKQVYQAAIRWYMEQVKAGLHQLK